MQVIKAVWECLGLMTTMGKSVFPCNFEDSFQSQENDEKVCHPLAGSKLLNSLTKLMTVPERMKLGEGAAS